MNLLTTKLKALPTEDFIATPLLPQNATPDFEDYISKHSFNINNLPAEHDTVLFYKDIPIGSRSNLITITGKAKSRKTVIASAIGTSFFTENENFLGFRSSISQDDNILHIDTEQGFKHYYYSVKRMFDDADLKTKPDAFTSVHTRDADVKYRIELTEYMLEKLRPRALIIDGVTDFVYDINSQEEAVKIGEKIMQWSSKYDMVVVVVIHTTKTTGYMTGAIGTYLEKKCETSIKVEKDEKDESISHVSCHLSRNKSFPDFSITFNESTRRYEVLNETQVTSKGKGDKSPQLYAMDIHKEVLNRVFMMGSTLNESEFRRQVKIKSGMITGDKLTVKDVENWIDFYNSNAMISNSGVGWVRTGAPVLQTTLFTKATAEYGEENNMPDDPMDDLPF